MQIAEFVTENRVNVCFDTQYELCLSFPPVDLNSLYNNTHNSDRNIHRATSQQPGSPSLPSPHPQHAAPYLPSTSSP